MKNPKIIQSLREQTKILRESNADLVKGIRRCLVQKEIDPKRIIVVAWFPDDVSFEYGIIVNSNKQVFQFGYDYFEEEGKGEFTEWRDITNNWREIPLFKNIEIVLSEYVELQKTS